MLLKPHAANSSVTTACGNCGMEDQLLLHNVRYRGSFRHLCTTCVLRLHPQSFCPTCFQVYPPPPPNGAVLTCVRCGSSTHSQCVSAPPKPYICPLCVNPNACVFKLKPAEKDNAEGLCVLMMDRDAARKLLAAAKIVCASLNKAAAAAKAEAERRAKEAVLTRRKAQEALEHLAHLMMKEKLRKRENPPIRLGYGEGGFRGSNSKASPVILGTKPNSAAPLPTSMMGDAGEIVEWSDSDIDQILFSDEDTGAGNLDF
ncbi:hypothetical protein ACS0TY_005489 [Phlomoides rotata]